MNTYRQAFLVGMISLCAPLSAWAADVPREVTTEFRQHVTRRDKLVRELNALDQKAADSVAAGNEPNSVHAQQVELRDQVDLIQLRLETMAVRWSLEIPDPPAPGSSKMDEAAVVNERIEGAFFGGRERADQVLQDRCRKVIASMPLESFLARAE